MYGSDARRGSGSVGLLKWHRMSDRTASLKTKWQRCPGRRGKCWARVGALAYNYGM